MAIFNTTGLASAPLTNVVDEGRYLVRIVAAEARTSKQKGTPELHLDTVIVSGPAQANGIVPTGKHIFGSIYVPVAAGTGREMGLRSVAKLCVATGVERTDETDPADFIGKEVIVRVIHEMYNGEPREKFADFIKAE